MSVVPVEVYDVTHSKSLWILLNVTLMVYGICCISLLSHNENPETLQQNRRLRMYIVILLFIVSGYNIAYFLLRSSVAIAYFQPTFNGGERPSTLLMFLDDMIPVFVIILTGGLLVWRCYIMQKPPLFRSEVRWEAILRIFPACLWGVIIVTGSIAAWLMMSSQEPSMLSASKALRATALYSNVVLSTYATFFITVRLLQQRSGAISLLGQKTDVSRYLNVVGILLESAAFGVPNTIAIVVVAGLEARTGTAELPNAMVNQAFASLLIIRQIVSGREFRRTQEEELENLSEEKIRARKESTFARVETLDVSDACRGSRNSGSCMYALERAEITTYR